MMSYILVNKKTNKIIELSKDKVLDSLYYLETRLPTEGELNKYNKKISLEKLRNDISMIDNKIPLYDTYSRNLYLITKENVYHRVIYNHYRFIGNRTLKYFKNKRDKLVDTVKQLKKDTSSDYITQHKNKFMIRKYDKLVLLTNFLSNFNLDVLIRTYTFVIYHYANSIGGNITLCQRPSFIPEFKHILPYYSRSELFNLALNMELIKVNTKTYEDDELMELCFKIKANDITATTLLDHNIHIVNNDKVGIVQYYSLQGSFFLNRYLRGISDTSYRDIYLENIIRSMWELVDTSPTFDKSYILYRFIQDDTHLDGLEIGDIYVPQSFTSTTRNPFYKSDNYLFGFILIKIKIPKNVKGVGLCMETISHFPEEEEIILRPFSKLRLDKKDSNVKYFHIDSEFGLNIKTKYEFTYKGKETMSFPDDLTRLDKEEPLDFLDIIKRNNDDSFDERVKKFIENYLNELYQFDTMIGSTVYTVVMENYNSADVYKEFYASTTTEGNSFYSINNNYITFFIEIGTENNESFMYVNYYFKHSYSNLKKEYSDREFIEFLSKVAVYFGIEKIILYTDYESCDIANEIKSKDKIKTYYGGNYCVDYYKYFKFGTKRYSDIDTSELYPEYKLYFLNRLKKVSPLEVLSKIDNDEIYQIYEETYKKIVDPSKNNLANFYIWMIEHHCYLIEYLVYKMKTIFKSNNPFEQDYYVLDPGAYLYNNKLIHYIDSSRTDEHNMKIKIKLPKNTYRLNVKTL
jgi:hypothetical protein